MTSHASPIDFSPDTQLFKDIELTAMLENWCGELSAAQRRVRDAFLQSISFSNTSIFDAFPHHPFWTQWKSKSSKFQSGAIAVAVKTTSDIKWIDVLFDVVPEKDKKDILNMLLKNSFDSIGEKNIDKVFQYALSYNIKLSSVFTEDNLIHVAKFAPRDIVTFFVNHSEFPKKRFLGFENSICARRSTKKLFPRQKILETLWEKWGPLEENQYQDIFKNAFSFVSKNNKDDFESYVLSFHNPNSQFWTSADDITFIGYYLLDGQIKRMEDKIKQENYVLPPKAWEDFFKAHPPKNEEQKAQWIKISLNRSLNPSPQSSKIRKM